MSAIRWRLWPFVLLVLLAVLAGLQYRWAGQISAAERERLERSLGASSRRFAQDVSEAAFGALRFFRLDEPSDVAGSLSRALDAYEAENGSLELVDAVYVVDSHESISRWDRANGLTAIEWPSSLTGLRDRLARGGPPSQRRWRDRGRQPPLPVMWPEPLTLALPMVGWQGRRPAGVRGYTLVSFDVEAIRSELLPALVRRHFGDEFDVVVVDGDDKILYSTSEDADLDDADARGELLRLGAPFDAARGNARRAPRPPGRPDWRRDVGSVGWRFLVRHRDGSLEEAVASARRRNLAVSFGILGLLGASVVLVAATTRKATELNNQKMEFIAGVSHELRTPLAVLRSAGQNLADGSVSSPEQVARYGELIETEGRRLNDLVEQVLELAGIQSQKRRHRHEVVDVRSVVAEAVADCEAVARDRRVSLVAADALASISVSGESEALRRAVVNLITNAVKHGSDDNAVEISAQARGDMAAIVVSDRGPGIPPEEREKVFEAFYRGERAQRGQVRGSGLGLSLVQHIAREHGGRVELDASSAGGCEFTLLLPLHREGE